VKKVAFREGKGLGRVFGGRRSARWPRSDDADEPFPGYGQLGEKELIAQLHKHSQVELEGIEAYERSHGSRTRVLNKLHYLRQREPMAAYDALSPGEVVAALERADLATIDHVRAYERKFANRAEVLDAVARIRHHLTEQAPSHDTRAYTATRYGPPTAGASSRAPGPGELAANKELVTGFYSEVINDRDLDAIDRLLSDEFVHNGHRRARDRQRSEVAQLLDAFPDLETETELILAEGDLVSAHQRWTGTHRGTTAGLEPSGRMVEFTSTAMFRIREGRITEAWDEIDLAIVARRLEGAE
jgi:steroid delta-isomerase-like uncharacterized protein